MCIVRSTHDGIEANLKFKCVRFIKMSFLALEVLLIPSKLQVSQCAVSTGDPGR